MWNQTVSKTKKSALVTTHCIICNAYFRYGYRKDGKWHVEKGPEYCQNPKSLVEGLRIQRESIITKIRMQDASKTDIPQIGHWSFFDDQNSGNCHVFTISPENHSIPIRQLTFYLANDIPQTKVYIDSPGSFQSGDNIFLKQCSEVFSMDYENCKMLDHMGRECDNDINYNKDNCYRDKIFQTSMKKLNCTWPFLNDKNHICTHRDIAKEATKIGQTIRKSVKCKSSCNYLKASMSFLKSYCAKNGPQHLRFLFKEHRKVFKAYYTYTELSLIAEIGGYVGLFLGWSIYQITDVPHYFIKLKQRLF